MQLVNVALCDRAETRTVVHVKLARYMRLSLEEIGRTPIRRLNEYMLVLRDVLKAEAGETTADNSHQTDRA